MSGPHARVRGAEKAVSNFHQKSIVNFPGKSKIEELEVFI